MGASRRSVPTRGHQRGRNVGVRGAHARKRTEGRALAASSRTVRGRSRGEVEPDATLDETRLARASGAALAASLARGASRGAVRVRVRAIAGWVGLRRYTVYAEEDRRWSWAQTSSTAS